MNIPTYATCSMCNSWVQGPLWTHGTCPKFDEAANEGLAQAGMQAKVHNLKLAHNTRPCPEWEASAEGQRDIDLYEADLDHTQGKRPLPAPQFDHEVHHGLR